MARILLGVSGGIAAYKALEFVRLATGAGHVLRVIQTPNSQRFVGAPSFAALSGAPVLVDEFERDPARGAFPGQPAPGHEPLSHLQLAGDADVYLVAPASANTLAKLAHGLADNLLTSAALAAQCPLIVAPAMNNHMYEHPATQENLALLRARGATVLGPGSGRLGSHGEWGPGRLAEPPQLLEACEALLADAAGADRPWAGLRVLVSAGGTREPIDSVRFVGNRSSGRMGLALAAAARSRGAAVTVVAANVSLARPPDVRYVDVHTAEEMRDACEALFPDCDVLLMAAAVADFRPAQAAAEKIKKTGHERLALELEATPDIISALSRRRRPDQTLIGFAAEHGEQAVAAGRQKLAAKGLDAVVVNDISRPEIGFEVDANEVTIVSAAEDRHVAIASKEDVARAVLETVDRLRTRPSAHA
jgi:phosphopantothenoylcysteine decarboxylase/phosphopantothenate--cysteine ligase